MVYTVNDDLRDYPMSKDGSFEGESFMANLRVEKQLGRAGLVSITGFQQTDDEVFEDFDGSDFDIGVTDSDTEADTFSQEFRLVGDDYLAGVYFYNDSADSEYAFTWGVDSLPFFVSGQPGVTDSGTADVETSSLALFGEYTFYLADMVSLTLGAAIPTTRRTSS